MKWFLAAFKKYAVINGRARRSEYWYFTLFYALFLCVAIGMDNLFDTNIGNLPRWKNGYANYQFITSLGIKTTEMIQAQTKCRDPPGPTGLTPLAYNDTTGLSEFIEIVYHLRAIGDPDVDFW